MAMLSATTLIIVLYKTARAAPAGSSNKLATSNVASIDPLPDTYDYDESQYYGGASNKPTTVLANDDGDCADIWSAGKCREKADAGKCNQPSAVLKCKAACGLCSYPPSAPPSLTCNDLAACNKYSSPPSPPPSSSVSPCESDIKDSYGNCVPATCETWFDGCNNCGVMLNGLLHCTKKFCMVRQEEKCTEYTSSVVVSFRYIYERFCS